jgi:hypothetical protein
VWPALPTLPLLCSLRISSPAASITPFSLSYRPLTPNIHPYKPLILTCSLTARIIANVPPRFGDGAPIPSAAVVMAIPRARNEIPPSSPPLRRVKTLRGGQDPRLHWVNTNSLRDTGFSGNRLATVQPGSSLYGGTGGSHLYPWNPSGEYIFTHGREHSISRSYVDMSSESREHISDEERSSKSRPSLGNFG